MEDLPEPVMPDAEVRRLIGGISDLDAWLSDFPPRILVV
tara:strand:+ start:1018 stop:1134 length:117 start_codon:yes stop_codon:yes gene_type:complete